MSSSHAEALGSSLRTRPASETLEIARRIAPSLGITRVTDITRLDRVGIPVSTSIRPSAHEASLCVCAGKGLTWEDAHVGAYMEAIEFALAEPGRSPVAIVTATARQVLDGSPESLLALCPKLDATIVLDAPLPCAPAEEIVTGKPCLLPADLVFHPGPSLADPTAPYMSSTNGLASGNTLLEATVHGVAELIERDIQSFRVFRDRSRLVDPGTFPPTVAALRDKIDEAGLKLYVRFVPNVFGLPYFSAVVHDPETSSPLYVNGGYGLHPHRQISLVRAVTEAVQSRLSFIHGGRDSLSIDYRAYDGQTPEQLAARIAAQVHAASDPANAMPYEDAPDFSDRAADLDSAFTLLTELLAGQGMHRICRTAFTRPDDPLQVVKIVIPGLEFWDERSHRIGPRLRDYVEALQSDPLRRPDAPCAA